MIIKIVVICTSKRERILTTIAFFSGVGAGKRKRIQIRLIIELYQVGICLDDDFFSQLLRSLVGKVKGYVKIVISRMLVMMMTSCYY